MRIASASHPVAGPADPVLERLASFAASRRALVLVAAWGVAEAIALPVVPDIVLLLLALARPARAARLFAAAVLGALAGSLVLYAACLLAPDAVGAMLTTLPGIDRSMVAQASVTVAGGSPVAIALFGPGPPLKVYTYAWATGPASLLPLLAGVALNRVTRIGPGLLVLAVLGRLAPAFLCRHERVVIGLYAGIWAVVYAVSWGLV